jgi:Skp family chaperone for outer membrane proteins
VGEITRMQEDIEMIPADDTSGTRMQKIRDLRIKEVEARALSQFVQEQLSLEKGQMLATLYNKIQTSVCDILARDGWDIILIDDSGLDLPQMAQEAQMLQLILQRRVLCAADRVDITEDVKTLMNNNFNAPRP